MSLPLPEVLPETLIRLSAGDDWSAVFTIMGDGDDAADITGWTFTAQAAESYDAETKIDITVTAQTPATDGKIELALDSADTISLDPVQLLWDVVAVDGDGKRRRVLRGPMVIGPCLTVVSS